jgi:transposase-like protein
MTKAEQARIVAWRLRILKHAESEPRYVAQTCRYYGISRTAFYRWKKRFDEHGEAGHIEQHGAGRGTWYGLA